MHLGSRGVALFLLAAAAVTAEESAGTGAAGQKSSSDWDIALYPVMVFAPMFGATARIPPDAVSPPIGGGGSSNTGDATSSGISGAYMGGFRIEKSKWVVHSAFEWADVSADRQTPRVKIDSSIIYADLMGGREILPNLYLEGGVRRLVLKFDATVGTESATWKPGIWDPIVGMSYRKHLGRKWILNAHADGGGFGVGSERDIYGSATAEWKFAKHFGLGFGAGVFHFLINEKVRNRDLQMKQTLYGPIIGFGIYF